MTKKWFLPLTYLAIITGSAFGFAPKAMAQASRTGFFMETYKYAHQHNAAMLEDRPYTAIPLVGNVYFNASTSHPLNAFFYKTANKNGSTDYNFFTEKAVPEQLFYQRLGNQNVMSNAELNLNILSFASAFGSGTSLFEVNLRSNGSSEVPNQLFHYFKNPKLQNDYGFDQLSLQHRTYGEVALGYAHTVGNHFTVGAKVKGLMALAYADGKVQDVQVKTGREQWAASGRAFASVAVGNTEFHFDKKGHLQEQEPKNLSIAPAGWGLATDLGVTYEVHGVEGLTLSAAVTDLGFIHYNKVQKLGNEVNRTWTIEDAKKRATNLVNNGNNPLVPNTDPSAVVKKEFEGELQDVLALNDNGTAAMTSQLRTTLNLGATYELPFVKHLNVGALYSRYFDGDFQQSQLTLGAAWHPIQPIELGLSSTFVNNHVNYGAMLTLQAPRFQVFVGTDVIPTSFGTDGLLERYAGNINMGITIPLD